MMIRRVSQVIALGMFSLLVVPMSAEAGKVNLSGYEESPAVSTTGSAKFKFKIDEQAQTIDYELSYENLESDVTQAHVHIAQLSINGGIAFFLCSNLGNGPAGTQACPPAPATITGTISPEDIIGPSAQGVSAGEFDEVVAAIRAKAAYVNVHTTGLPGGEIRAQLK